MCIIILFRKENSRTRKCYFNSILHLGLYISDRNVAQAVDFSSVGVSHIIRLYIGMKDHSLYVHAPNEKSWKLLNGTTMQILLFENNRQLQTVVEQNREKEKGKKEQPLFLKLMKRNCLNEFDQLLYI